MIITINADSSHAWAGETRDVPDGLANSMLRRGIATKGHKLDDPPDDGPAKPTKVTKKAAKKS